MKIENIPVSQLRSPEWNANRMDDGMRRHLASSVKRFGMVQPLAVRKLPDGTYEILSGSQRLRELKAAGAETAPCVVVDLDDTEAKLLSQAMNSIHGEDDLALRAELFREVLERKSSQEVTELLPGTKESFEALANLGSQDLSSHLQDWNGARKRNPKQYLVRLTEEQLETVQRAVDLINRAQNIDTDNPRGDAIFELARLYLDQEE
ncbi:MAG: ParB N-terminal domain-containing protein [SAR202 cluster bacterium]|nr:ParB N-terminal domain-containing protein [SAR202 cluster bacterium]MDP6512175.1 ParB N-terminal domain-containing protein [SAR202 cluster bacterium]MDP6714680.1 ParB N-terminal domain-containing protein [SAR202 cluster bacterium]